MIYFIMYPPLISLIFVRNQILLVLIHDVSNKLYIHVIIIQFSYQVCYILLLDAVLLPFLNNVYWLVQNHIK